MSAGAQLRITCPTTGKQVFGTQARADHFRVTLEAQERRPYRIYLCPACGWWHLTSRRRRWWAA